MKCQPRLNEKHKPVLHYISSFEKALLWKVIRLSYQFFYFLFTSIFISADIILTTFWNFIQHYLEKILVPYFPFLTDLIFQRLIWKMIAVYFLWFDYWTVKEWKTAKVHNHSVAAYQLFTQMTGLIFDMFTAAMFFFSEKFLNVCKPRTTYPFWQPGPPGLAFYGSGLACLPSWLGMVNTGWLRSM